MSRFAVVIRRAVLGCLPVFILIVLAPKPFARAQFSALFDGLTSTVTDIGSSITGINQTQKQMQSLENSTVHPLNDRANIQSNGSTIVSSYRGWMGTVFSAQTNSAQLPSSQALENQLLSGASTASPNPNLSSAYTSTYGSRPTTVQASAAVALAVDMGDASAQDAMQLAVLADSTAETTIQEANTLESQALTTSAGSAPQVEATALAYEIGAMAIEHKVLASQLRSTAAVLAYEGTRRKQAIISNTNAIGANYGGGLR